MVKLATASATPFDNSQGCRRDAQHGEKAGKNNGGRLVTEITQRACQPGTADRSVEPAPRASSPLPSDRSVS
ncbi:MAG: hypothetical protein MZV70_55730 [Desulfobacterales bacterium]|nr:hypothetical protein [Desulfobacterales bacterium]